MHDFARDYAYAADAKPVCCRSSAATFEGFRRADGRVGTRNYVGILTSVNCSATVARFIAEAANRSGTARRLPNVDGVVALTHGTGCGIDYQGRGLRRAEAHDWGYATQSQYGGRAVVGLGCEVNQIGG
jgi:altronate hydrolase